MKLLEILIKAAVETPPCSVCHKRVMHDRGYSKIRWLQRNATP